MTKGIEKITIEELNKIVKMNRGEILGACVSHTYVKSPLPNSDSEIIRMAGGEFYANGTPNFDAFASPLNEKRNPVIPLVYGKYFEGEKK